MNLNYKQKEDIMQSIFANHNSPIGFRSVYKGIPIDSYEQIKEFIDFTKYFVMFRGPRRRNASSTRKLLRSTSLRRYASQPIFALGLFESLAQFVLCCATTLLRLQLCMAELFWQPRAHEPITRRREHAVAAH